MERSKRVIFVSHCLLNQNVLPVGMEKYPGAVKELLEFFAEAGVGIVQMPDPETEYFGLDRKPKTKDDYDTKSFRKICRQFSKLILEQIQKYKQKNYNVVGLLGVEFSPTYAVHQITNGTKNTPGKGIFIEELEEEMRKKNFQVPIVGINMNNLFSSMEKLNALIKYS